MKDRLDAAAERARVGNWQVACTPERARARRARHGYIAKRWAPTDRSAAKPHSNPCRPRSALRAMPAIHAPTADQPRESDGDPAGAVHISSATGLALSRCELLLRHARGDFNLALERGFKESAHASTDPKQPTPEHQRATLTVVGGEIRYARSSPTLLSQHIFLVVEFLGERRRTECVRRSKHPQWSLSHFDVMLPEHERSKAFAGRVSVSLCDLDNNILGSGSCDFSHLAASGVATVQLLATCELREQSSAVAGTIELRMGIQLDSTVDNEPSEDSLTRNQSCPSNVQATCPASAFTNKTCRFASRLTLI